MKCGLVVSFVFEEIDRFQTSYLKRQASYLANIGMPERPKKRL